MKKLTLSRCVLLLLCATLAGCSTSKPGTTDLAKEGVKLMVLYPQPADVAQFERDYADHLKLLHQKANIPDGAPLPYTITKFAPTPDGPPPYYQLFTMYYPSAEALQQARGNLQEVAADAVRISSGGAPVVLIGSETP